ncbi:MAG: ATP-binding protein [Actinomycetota bacterium]
MGGERAKPQGQADEHPDGRYARLEMAADHARRHLALVQAAGAVLEAVVDDADVALARVLDVLVPEFADWCAVDVPDGDRVRSLGWRVSESLGPGPRAEAERLRASWSGPAAGVIASGQAALYIPGTTPPDRARALGSPPAGPGGAGSALVVPVRLRGLTMAAISCGTVPPRRGFRPSDVAAAEEVAGRAAFALERALLLRERQERAEEAGARAAQLRRLMEAALAVRSRHSLAEVLDVGAEQARRVMGASACVALVRPDDGQAGDGETANDAMGGGLAVSRAVPWPPEAVVDRLCQRARASAAPTPEPGPAPGVPPRPAGPGDGPGAVLTDTSGTVLGAIVVGERADGRPYAEHDETLLVSLAQLVSEAVEGARLYERARTSEARARALVDASPLAIVELGPTGEVRDANAAAVRLLGWSGSVEPRRFPVLYPPEGGAVDLAAEVAEGPTMVDRRLVLQSAAVVELSVSTAPLPAAGLLVVLADVTERRRLEAEMAKTKRMEAVGRMAGGVAHDFNNLLTVVLGHSHLLLRSMDEGDGGRAHVESIKEAGERAASLSAQLLTIARGQIVTPALVDLNHVVESMNVVVRRLLPEDVEVRVSTAPGVPAVVADAGQLEQVLLNLAVNARDAVAGGGLVEIATSGRPGWAVLRVSDDGEGMTAEVRERCFEPFFSTRRRASAGLGLATVYGIVTQAGGRVEVDSAPGQGTTFTVELPAAAGTPAVPAASPAAAPGGRERVLLVEDDPAVRSLTRDMLEREGYGVTEAPGGAEALRLARAGERFDLLVTDVVMPEVDGVSLAAVLAELCGPLPTLFISGYLDTSAGWSEGLPEGAQLLAKPFGPGELAAKAREAIAGRGAQGSR